MPVGRTSRFRAALMGVYLRAFGSLRAGDRRHHLWGVAAVVMAAGAVVRVAARRAVGRR